MSALCPSKSEQRVVLGQLLRSINVAEQYAPNSWAVTLFGNGFRLNVGPVEVYTFFGSEVRLFLLGTAPIEAQQHGELFPTDFYSVPQPQSFFTASVSNFDSVAIALQSIHGEFVHAAAVTSKGAPRKASSFARSHSPGLLSYAKHVVSENSSVPTEHQTKDYYFEGAMRHVSTNVDERNRTARDECVKTHGSTCVICGFNFQASYGAGAAGFIHVHHVTPLSTIGQAYKRTRSTQSKTLCRCAQIVIQWFIWSTRHIQLSKLKTCFSQIKPSKASQPMPLPSLRCFKLAAEPPPAQIYDRGSQRIYD